jgi:hypothetical protein
MGTSHRPTKTARTLQEILTGHHGHKVHGEIQTPVAKGMYKHKETRNAGHPMMSTVPHAQGNFIQHAWKTRATSQHAQHCQQDGSYAILDENFCSLTSRVCAFVGGLSYCRVLKTAVRPGSLMCPTCVTHWAGLHQCEQSSQGEGTCISTTTTSC